MFHIGHSGPNHKTMTKNHFSTTTPLPLQLLSYMRMGKIKIEDITTDVLFLAEYLSMERLLTAVKARWFVNIVNIGKGEVPPLDSVDFEESTASLFDKEHGGISDAISSGLFPLFLKSEEMDFAVIRARTDLLDRPFRIEAIHQFVSGHRHDFEVLDSCSIIGAINGLYSMGYTFIERQGHSNDWIDEVTEFSAPRFGPLLQRPDRHRRFRMSITLFRSRSTIPPSGNIFILPKGEAKVQGFTKQFAFAVSDHKNGPRIIAPTEFGDDNFHPFCTLHCGNISCSCA